MQSATTIDTHRPGAFCAPRASRRVLAPTKPHAASGFALLRPVLLVAGAIAAGVAFYLGGIEAATIAIAAAIALWAFVEPRAALWLATAFMAYLFVFFQSTAPLGEDLPAEFLFWGIGVALITAGLTLACLFSRQVDWGHARRRLASPASNAMLAMLLLILASSVYGLEAGNQFFAVARQLFGCLLLPAYYFAAVVLFRASEDVALWLRRVSWVVALGSLWYAEKLSSLSFARGTYYREQSPLAAYGGAITVVAWIAMLHERRILRWLEALAQFLACISGTLLMGNRAALGSAAIAIAVMTALILWKRRILFLALAMTLVPIAVGLAPYLTTRLLESRNLTGMIAGRFIFALEEDQSYQGRVAQMEVVMNTVNDRPVLGAGMGSTNTFLMPGEHRLKVASVDNGWGFLLLKMGYLGLAVFLALLGFLLKSGLQELGRTADRSRRKTRLAIIGVFFYALVSFFGGPTFFHFSVAPFFAAFLGAQVGLSEAATSRASGCEEIAALPLSEGTT